MTLDKSTPLDQQALWASSRLRGMVALLRGIDECPEGSSHCCWQLAIRDLNAIAVQIDASEELRKDMLAAMKSVADMAVSWQPLSNGDISDVRRSIARAEGQ